MCVRELVGGCFFFFDQVIPAFNFLYLSRALLEKELESVGIRLNRTKPNIYFKVKDPFFSIFNLLVNQT